MRVPTLFARILSLAALVVAAAPAWGKDVDQRCWDMYRLTDLQYAVEPGQLVAASDAAPAHCRVRGVINRAIRVEVALPLQDWNGRMMFTAVGGAAGMIGDTTSLLGRGFAMASTDTGHEGQNFEFMVQPEALLDYAYRGVHLATGFAKQAITRFYGRPIDRAYLKGCSNGGRAALLEATRFPEDYDGIIAGAPAFRFQEFASWMIGGYRLQKAHPLTKEALALLGNASREACDGLDGVADGVIGDPRRCTREVFDPADLVCAEGQGGECLTPGQLETALYMYGDVRNAKGELLSPGVPPGAEDAGDWAFWMLENILQGSQAPSLIASMEDFIAMLKRGDPDFDVAKFDPATDRALLDDVTAPFDVRTADLSAFRERGGVLLIYQGWNDYPLRPQRAIDYLAAAERANGGPEATAKFFRLFLVPGMVHCAGGPGPWQADWVEPLVTWREQGQAPAQVVGTHPGHVQRFFHLASSDDATPRTPYTRPICAYPAHARYDGEGDVNAAASFQCVDDAVGAGGSD